MSNDTYEIELEVDDETIPVELEEPGPFTRLRLALEAPDPPEDEDDFISTDPEIVDFIIAVIEEVSDFPAEQDILDELPMRAFNDLVDASMQVFSGKEPDQRSTDDFRFDGNENSPFDAFDLDDDGTLDPDDWR